MSGQTNEFGLYIQAIKSRFWLVLLLVVIGVGAAYWAIGRRPSAYTATATVMVTAPVIMPAPPAGADRADTSFRQTSATTVNDILALMDSRPIASRVARRLDLSGPGIVQRSVRAVPERGTSLVRVLATSRNPERAANMANATAEEFIAYFRETNRNAVSETRRFVEEQLALSRARLEQSERALQGFRENRRILSPTEASSRALTAVSTVETEIETATRTLRETEARLGAARERLARERPTTVTQRATTENPVFRQIQGHLVDLEIRRAQMAQIYTPAHPRMEAISKEIADVRNRMLAEARTMVGEEVTAVNPIHTRLLGDMVTLDVERAAINARIEALQYTLRRRQQEIQSLPSAETEFNRLTRENRILESNYTTLSHRYQELLLRENEAGFSPASVQLIEAAAPPVSADANAFPRFGAAAGAIGFTLGILGALLLEALDDRIRSAQDAERVLGVPVLAQIPAHGQPRVAPAPAVFVLILLLVAGVAWAAIARGYLPVPGRVSEQVRGVTAVMASWVGASQPSALGLAAEDR